MKKIFLAINLFLCLPTISLAQEFDVHRLDFLPTNVKKVLLPQIDQLTDTSRYVSTGPNSESEKANFSHLKTHLDINASVDVVWEKYTKVRADEIWNGPLVNFVFAYSKQEGKFYYQGDLVPQFESGLVIQNYLKFLNQVIPVAVEVIRVDHEQKLIELAYVEGNASRGTQVLRFYKVKNGTRVEHHSYYKSKSKFRDAAMYPIFHSLTTGEHHKKMRKLIEN